MGEWRGVSQARTWGRKTPEEVWSLSGEGCEQEGRQRQAGFKCPRQS